MKTLRAKLMLGAVVSASIVSALLIIQFFSLSALDNEQAHGRRAAVAVKDAYDDSHLGEYLYSVIADAIINRGDNYEADWNEAKQVATHKIAVFRDDLSDPRDVVVLQAASEAFGELCDIFEQKLIPLLKKTPGVTPLMQDLDSLMDAQKIIMRDNFLTLADRLNKVADAHDDDFRHLAGLSLNLSLLLGGGGVLVNLLISLWNRRSVLRPLRAQLALLLDMAEGEADLTKRLDDARADEFGELGRRFNAFSGKLQTILGSVRRSMTDLSESSAQMAENTGRTAASVGQIAGSIDTVMDRITNQSASIAETSASVEQINKNVASFHQNVRNQSRDVEAASKELTEMVAEMRELAQKVESSSRQFVKLQTESSEGQTKMEAVIGLVREITAKSERLMETNEAISSIASQTNLLAMNAAIEAAHAGEAGKGFAVVSDEIRKLAESAAVQARQTSQVLKDIGSHIVQIDSASAESGESFTTIARQIEEVAGLQTTVERTLLAQVKSNETNQTMFQNIQSLSAEIASGSEEMTIGTQTILEEMTRLVEISLQIKTSMQEITSGTDAIEASVKNLSELTQTTTRAAEEAQAQTDRFKLE